MTSVLDPASALVTELQMMWLDDPIMKALWDGSMNWGDIPGILDDKPSRSLSICSEESDDLDLLALLSTHKRPVVVPVKTSSNCASIKQISDAPSFPAGRRTLMAKNLPRDITVQELRTVFEKYGAIRDIYIPKNMDKSSPYFGTIKGFAKIQFLKADDAARAYDAQWSRLTIRNKNVALEAAAEDR